MSEIKINGKVLEKRDYIIIKRGSLVESTQQRAPRKIITKAQRARFDRMIGNNVVWAGSGNYWFWTDISNVTEILK